MQDEDEAVRYRIAEGLGDVLMLRGRYEQAAPEFQLALTLAGSDVARAQVEGKLGELAFKRGDVKTSGERIERALRLLGRRIPKPSLTFFILVVCELLVHAFPTT